MKTKSMLFSLSFSHFSSYAEILDINAEDALSETEGTGPKFWLIGLNEGDKKYLKQMVG